MFKMMGTNKELFVDSQGVCIFCLEERSVSHLFAGSYRDETLNSNCTEKNDHGMTEVSLRSICRYLKINSRAVLLKSLRESVGVGLSEDGEESLFSSPCDFSVMLCNKCSVVVQKLTSFIRELELTQMLLNHNLRSLEDILKTSEQKEEGNRWRNHVKRSVNGAAAEQCNPMEVRLVENLREQTRENCSRKVDNYFKTAVPRVHLSRLSTNGIAFEDQLSVISNASLKQDQPWEFYDESMTDALSFEEAPSSSILFSVEEEEPPRNESVTLKSATSAATISIEQHAAVKLGNIVIQSSNPGNASQASYMNRNSTSCQFCPQAFLRPGKLEEHMVLCHHDKVFSNKLQRLTSEQFRTCCQNLVQMEIAACRQTANIASRPITHCSYCCASFSKLQDLEVHMCSRHTQELEEKLTGIQEDLFPIEIYQHQQSQSSSSSIKMEYIIFE